MFKNKTIIALICARGGSKRVPKKNIRLLAGKPLITYTIETALASNLFERVIVSTEDKEIAQIAKAGGAEVPFMRAKALAKDNLGRWIVLQETVKELAKRENYIPDIVVDLSPTSPLRSVQDIQKCLEKLFREKAEVVSTVYESERNPYFNMVELDKNGYARLVKEPKKRISRSQDAPKVYCLNDSINVVWREALLKISGLPSKNTKVVVMPRERSVDIDEEFDFKLAEYLITSTLAFSPRLRNSDDLGT